MSQLDATVENSKLPTHVDRLSGGYFVAVVGPSGAGKDTLIRMAQERLAGDISFVFARRVITRDSDSTEEHDSVSELEFSCLRAAHGFLLSWNANGLHYGLPADLRQDIAAGRVVIANVSRAVLPEIALQFSNHFVIHVTASPEILETRLAARGREDAAAQHQRLVRASQQDLVVKADLIIDNSSDLNASLLRFEQALHSLRYALPLGL